MAALSNLLMMVIILPSQNGYALILILIFIIRTSNSLKTCPPIYPRIY